MAKIMDNPDKLATYRIQKWKTIKIKPKHNMC